MSGYQQPTDTPEFWSYLAAEFRKMPWPSRLAAMFVDDICDVTDGSASEQDVFRNLATKGAIAASVSGIAGWLNLLRDEGNDFVAPYGSKDKGGWIQNPRQASVDYCVVRETRALERESAAVDTGAQSELATQESAVREAIERPRRGAPRRKPNLHPEVEPFLEQVSRVAKRAITINDFCSVSGFADDTTFGFWRSGNTERCSPRHAKRFDATLRLTPEQFLARLKEQA